MNPNQYFSGETFETFNCNELQQLHAQNQSQNGVSTFTQIDEWSKSQNYHHQSMDIQTSYPKPQFSGECSQEEGDSIDNLDFSPSVFPFDVEEIVNHQYLSRDCTNDSEYSKLYLKNKAGLSSNHNEIRENMIENSTQQYKGIGMISKEINKSKGERRLVDPDNNAQNMNQMDAHSDGHTFQVHKDRPYPLIDITNFDTASFSNQISESHKNVSFFEEYLRKIRYMHSANTYRDNPEVLSYIQPQTPSVNCHNSFESYQSSGKKYDSRHTLSSSGGNLFTIPMKGSMPNNETDFEQLVRENTNCGIDYDNFCNQLNTNSRTKPPYSSKNNQNPEPFATPTMSDDLDISEKYFPSVPEMSTYSHPHPKNRSDHFKPSNSEPNMGCSQEQYANVSRCSASTNVDTHANLATSYSNFANFFQDDNYLINYSEMESNIPTNPSLEKNCNPGLLNRESSSSLCKSSSFTRQNTEILYDADSNKTRFICHICNRSFKRSYIKIHLRTHNKEQHYKCNVCEFSSKLYSNLHYHKNRWHPNELSYKCTICNKYFDTKQILQDHLINHSNEECFRCLLCPKLYKHHRTLHRHIESKHLIEGSQATADEVRSKCINCLQRSSLNAY